MSPKRRLVQRVCSEPQLLVHVHAIFQKKLDYFSMPLARSPRQSGETHWTSSIHIRAVGNEGTYHMKIAASCGFNQSWRCVTFWQRCGLRSLSSSKVVRIAVAAL